MVWGLIDAKLLVVFVAFTGWMNIVSAPVLATQSVRRLFYRWPTTRLTVNYVMGMTAFTVVHLAVLFVGLMITTRTGSINLMEFFKITIGLTVGVLVVGWVGISVGLPRWGRWEPTGEGFDGRLVLVVGAFWYLAWTVLCVFLLNMILFLLAFPDQ